MDPSTLSASPATPWTNAAAGSGTTPEATAAEKRTRCSLRRTPRTGADLLTDRQKTRLAVLFAADEHVQVQATWGIYQRPWARIRPLAKVSVTFTLTRYAPRRLRTPLECSPVLSTALTRYDPACERVMWMGEHRGCAVVRAGRLTIVLLLACALVTLPATPSHAGTPSAAVSDAAAYSAARSVTSYISVVDRSSGAVLAQTGNAQSQVASESIMKLLLASYYLVLYGGYRQTPSAVRSRLSYMLRYSDNDITNSLFSSAAIPTIASRYGMGRTTNATDRAGHWGAARITAADMTHFLYRASRDAAVGPWLIPVMSQTARYGSNGFNQAFGLNALSGTHGSKQGWGCDSFWTAHACAVNSVGYTDNKFVAILQLSDSYPDPARGTATHSAQVIQASTVRASPIGALDGARNPAKNVLTVAGWAADPEAPGQREQVHVYVSTAGATRGFPNIFTGRARPDVARARPWAGGSTGFSAALAPAGVGVNKVCAYAIGVGSRGVHPLIGCRTVDVRNAFGHLDGIAARPRTITAGGWALNPNIPAERVAIHLYDTAQSGRKIYVGSAGRLRPDVARAYPSFDRNHGFSFTIAGAEPGQHNVCVYAITTGGGISNPLLGCRSIAVPA